MKPFNAYQRFDYRTPGAAQRASGFTPDQYNARAQNVQAWQMPRAPSLQGTGYTSPIAAALANHGVNPALQRQIGNYGVNKGLERNNLAAQAFMRGQGITPRSSPQQTGAGLDAYQRSQQARNQMPKRGLLQSLPFQLATAALGSAFFGPAISGALSGLGTAGTAAKVAGIANTGKNVIRAI